MKKFFIITIIYFISSIVSATETTDGKDYKDELEHFFNSIKLSLKVDDFDQLADEIVLPITLRNGQEEMYARSKSELTAALKKTITSDFKNAILCQEFDELKQNSHGVRGVRGSIWISKVYVGTKKYELLSSEEKKSQDMWRYKITALNNTFLVKEFLKNCSNN